MRMILIIALGMLAPAAVGACGEEDGESGTQVVATTGVNRALAEEVGGDDVTVTQLVPDGADPHDFSLSAQDRLELEQADLVVANGAELEAGIPLDETDAPVVELADHAGELRDGDPHLWMDPTKVAAALPALGDALADADPSSASDYRERAGAYAKELDELDREIARDVGAIPSADRELVTSHDALGYFADRYGLEVVASPFGPLGAESEPSAEALQEAIDAVEETGTPAVFAQAEDDPSVMERIAGETGAEVVDGLLVESPGDAGTYEAMLRTDAELITAALGESADGP
jgi:ABC-type Zn uptake system ZnuABC Zn-binding protein ZnuA